MSRNFLSEWHKPWIKKETFVKKKKRAAMTVKRLKSAYPDAKIVLKFGNNIQLLVAVILSAQCTDKKVNEVTEKLFRKYKTARDFARANTNMLEKEIRSTGFYRAKAKSIQASCKVIAEKFKGKLPRTMEEILQLRGVARKTANVVLGNAYGIVNGVAVDTHVRRLAQRLGLTKEDSPEKIERNLMAVIPQEDWFKLTYLFIEHGRAVCIAQKPKCGDCVLNSICPSTRI